MERARRHGLRRCMAVVLHGLSSAYSFIRFPVLNFSIMVPVLGALTATPSLTGPQVLGLIGVAVTFHNFGYVLNDVVDLPLDRTEPLRREYPLVRGAIPPGHALLFALLQVPAALLVTAWLEPPARAYAALIGAFALGAAYDLWGKRIILPLFADAIQGTAWVLLVLYGAIVAGRPPTALTGALSGLVFVLVVMINGVHGGLRDLANDYRCGARTTPIFLGAVPKGDAGVIVPRRLILYALVLQVLFAAAALLPLLYNWFNYGPRAWLATTSAILLVLALLAMLLVRAFNASHDKWEMIRWGAIHLFLSVGLLLVPFALYMERSALLVLMCIYLVPVITMLMRYGLKWG